MEIKILDYSIDMMKVLTPIIYIILGVLFFKIIKGIIKKAKFARNKLKQSQIQRIETIKIIIINIIKYIIITLVLLSVLSSFGINVNKILTGLGIGTAIIGLAFQDLAKDIIAGFSIITEGAYEVGDTIEVEGFMGEVVFIGLRTTRIKNFKGAIKIISNRYMDNIINYSDNNSLAVVDVGIAYENNEKEIEETFEKLFNRLNGKIPHATKDLELWGVNSLGDSSVVYRVVVETEPMQHLSTERYLRKEIKKEFDKSGIKIPYQQIEIHNGK